MGLFHDKCTAIVDAVTGEALAGDELAEALAQRRTNRNGSVLTGGRAWKICGNNVSKKARCCSKCGSRAPGGWIKCPVCHNWIGAEDAFCPHCDHPLHPEEHADFAGNIWRRGTGLFAQRFEITDGARVLKSGLHVEEGTVAVLLDSGKESCILGPGRHDPDGSLRKINWFGNPPPRSVLMVDSGEVVFRLDIDGKSIDPNDPASHSLEGKVVPTGTATQSPFSALRTSENLPIRLMAEITMRFVPSRADDFIANLLKEMRSITYNGIGEWFVPEATYAAKNLCATTSVADLVLDPQRRKMFEDALAQTIRESAKSCGLELVRVGTVEFICREYEDLRRQYGELDVRRRQYEYDQQVLELVRSKETAGIADSHAVIDRDNADAEFKAKKEVELSEYLEQLAQEKGLAALDRSEELDIARQLSSGRISSTAAAQALERLAETHRDSMQRIAYTQEVTVAGIRNKIEQSRILADEDRAENIRGARNTVDVNDIAREDQLKNAQNQTAIYTETTVGRAAADAAAEKHKAEQEKSRQEARTSVVDVDLYEASGWEDVRKKKQDIELEGEARREEIAAKADADRARTVKGMTPLEAATWSQEPGARADFLKYARELIQKEMSPEQILASLAGESVDSADALKAMYSAKDSASRELLDEVRKMYAQSLGRDDAMMERFTQMLDRVSGMMSDTATAAAKRVDPAPVLPPSQQIIK